MKPISEVFHGDCMAFMAGLPDGYFELAVVDPPYGIGEALVKGGGGGGWANMVNSGADEWDIAPPPEYFKELFRVSKNQIIWGGNYFELPACKMPICWDKVRPNQKNAGEWEYAWTSFVGRARLFSYCANGGFILKDARIHPTQKPVALYEWILRNYAKPGDKILDTHLGSQSSRIAAYKMGFDFWGCEIDGDYIRDGNARFEKEIAMPLFDTPKPALQSQLNFTAL